MAKFGDSTRTSLNKIVEKVWVHGEHCEGFGRPRDSCTVDLLGVHIRELNATAERYNLRWNSAPGCSNFLFSEFLDYTGNQAEAETQLAERVFIHNNTVWDTVGFAPRQRAVGESATVPTIGTVPPPT